MTSAGNTPAAVRGRWLLSLALLVAVGLRVYAECVYVDLNLDKVRQLLIAESFAGGRGFALVTVDPADLARTVSQQVGQWPIGYSLLVCAVDGLVGDLMLSALLIDIAAVVMTVWCLHAMLGLLGVGGAVRASFLVFTAFSFAPYYWLGSTDLLSVAFYLLALTLTLRCCAARRWRAGTAVAIGLSLLVAASFRFPYYPMAAIVPGCLVVFGIWTRDSGMRRGGFIAGCAAALPLLGLIAIHRYLFGAALRGYSGDSSYPGNLLHIDAFPLNAAVYTDLLINNLHAVLPGLDGTVRILTWVVSAAILFVIFRPLGGMFRRLIRRETLALPHLYHGLAVVTVIVNVALLAWFSYTHRPETGWTEFFTYVKETRYYVPSMLLIQISLILVLCGQDGAGGLVRKVGRAGLVAALAFSVSYGFYRMVKVHVLDDPTILERKQRVVSKTLAKMREVRGDRDSPMVYAEGISDHHLHLLDLNSDARIVRDYRELLSGSLPTTGPVELFISIPTTRTTRETGFLKTHDATPVLKLPGGDLYYLPLPFRARR